jgi:hypothetical protein
MRAVTEMSGAPIATVENPVITRESGSSHLGVRFFSDL